MEENNWNSIYLFREGIFLKAYQHSACLVHLYIHEFKLSKRYIKSVNENVISLGFPQTSAPKWLNGLKHYDISDCVVKCEIGKTLTETEYYTWMESVAVNQSDRFTAHTHVIEKAPVYKTAYDLMIQIFSFSVNVSRNVQNPLCNRLKGLSYELCCLLRNLYDSKEIDDAFEAAKSKCDEIEFILQILKDMRELSLNSFALASERIVSVSIQLAALRGKAKA